MDHNVVINITRKGDVGLFRHADKSTVLQEARVFNSSPINVRKCRLLLTKIIYLLHVGEPFNVKEATDLFFNVIKLFQSKDVSFFFFLILHEKKQPLHTQANTNTQCRHRYVK